MAPDQRADQAAGGRFALVHPSSARRGSPPRLPSPLGAVRLSANGVWRCSTATALAPVPTGMAWRPAMRPHPSRNGRSRDQGHGVAVHHHRRGLRLHLGHPPGHPPQPSVTWTSALARRAAAADLAERGWRWSGCSRPSWRSAASRLRPLPDPQADRAPPGHGMLPPLPGCSSVKRQRWL
jgi:hypothetical protein